MTLLSRSRETLVHLSFVSILLSAANSQNITLPGCPSTCGNFSIPYPFGIGNGCYLDPGFEVLCKSDINNNTTLAPHLAITGSQIIELSLDQLRVRAPSSFNCDGQAGVSNMLNLSVGPFTFSDTRNKLIAVGCDTYSYITDLDSEYTGGCASLCDERSSNVVLLNRSCSGIGCCQSSIPRGLKTFDLSEARIDTQARPSPSDTNCSFAALYDGQPSILLSNRSVRDAINYTISTSTVVLDWAIGTTSCPNLIRNLSDYLCGYNMRCTNSTTGIGHRCRCYPGYEGNPYLLEGCQANSQNITLPGCPSTCGNFSIPYPFGIGNGCYLDPGFEVLCKPHINNNTTLAPHLAITGGTEIIELSLDLLRVRGPSSFNCEGQAGVSNMLNLSVGPFTFSDTRNKLIAVGCDTYSYITDRDTDYTGGCASLSRHSKSRRLIESCVGIGCCQSSIPRGLKTFDLSVATINTTDSPSSAPNTNCSFAALYDGHPRILLSNRSVRDAINYTISTSTVVLDWAIGTTSCPNIISNSSDYLCGYKTRCDNSTTGIGHRCRCSSGYKGNPYLLNGCQDIDECKDPNQNRCANGTICINHEGGHSCSFYSPSKSSNKIEVVLIGTGSGIGLLLLLAIGFLLYKKLSKMKQIKHKQKFFKKNGGLLLEQQISSGEGKVDKTKLFVSEQLEKATDNYNESRILGKGGFGTVYKGMLTDGRIVAIKKSKTVDESQIEQFINELVILSQINHRHVVKLLGCCLETEVPLLVYQYISNGTLSYHLHDDNREVSLSWEHRLRIATEIAGALAYLHSSASTPIFHRDIKSTNILLDENYKATVSDFGISRSVPYEKTHLTTLVQGTFGYLDPEYFHTGQFTDKSDVYSFGVVLVELLTGRKPISFSGTEEEMNLAMHFTSSVKQDRLDQVLDTLVVNEARKEDVFVVAKLAKRCLKVVGKKRPTMKEVLVELEGLRRYQQQQPLVPKNYTESMNFMDEQAFLTMTGPQSM